MEHKNLVIVLLVVIVYYFYGSQFECTVSHVPSSISTN
jgi:hypothetical protein